MHKAVKIVILIIFVLAFCSCGNQGLSNRSIVKAILVDKENEKYKVSLVMLNCEPSSQIAEMKETAEVYTAISDTLSAALLNAEKLQNNTAFYAQNELLLVNIKALNKFNEIITYFTSDSFARPGMTIYLTTNTQEDFKNAKKSLPKIVNNTQNINVLNNEFSEARVYDVIQNDKSFSAILPLLEIDEEKGDYNVTSLGVVVNNQLTARINENDMALTIVLTKRSSILSIIDMNKTNLNFSANAIKLSNEMDKGKLKLYISGNIQEINIDDTSFLSQADAKKKEKEINEFVSQRCQDIFASYFQSTDLLKADWWYKMNNIYNEKSITFISQLKIV